jgi:hypothetical protein
MRVPPILLQKVMPKFSLVKSEFLFALRQPPGISRIRGV